MQVHTCRSKIQSGKTKSLVRTATEVKQLNNEAKNEKMLQNVQHFGDCEFSLKCIKQARGQFVTYSTWTRKSNILV